jgi:hypothetical protein
MWISLYKKAFSSLLFLSILFILPCELEAQSSATLVKGMRFIDVVKKFGTPSEKIERESRGQDIWIYGNKRVFFLNGVVVAWGSIDQKIPDEINLGVGELQALNSQESPQEMIEEESTLKTNPEVEQLLNEIMKISDSKDSVTVSGVDDNFSISPFPPSLPPSGVSPSAVTAPPRDSARLPTSLAPTSPGVVPNRASAMDVLPPLEFGAVKDLSSRLNAIQRRFPNRDLAINEDSQEDEEESDASEE